MIVVFGAGAIGCHTGGMLAAAGQPVGFIGRQPMLDALAVGFEVAVLDGAPITVASESFLSSSSPQIMADAEMVLVCVKSQDSAEAAETIARYAPQDAAVISLQNGLTNADTLGATLGADRVAAGMVGYNVIRPEPNAFVQATEGRVYVDARGAALAAALQSSPLVCDVHSNLEGLQWSKLILNLNNALNLLSGTGLRDELLDRNWRRVFAACVAEGLAVAHAEQVKLSRIGKVHPKLLPFLLRLPDVIFERLASSMLKIDPTATTSMVDDYRLGRSPEVDWLNGEIVKRAEALGMPASVNAKVTAFIHDVFADSSRPAVSVDPRSFLEEA